MSFKKDVEIGRSGENKISKLLNDAGFFSSVVNNGDKYDLACHFNGKPFFVEVKCDHKSLVTKNIAFEIKNIKKNKDSGVLSTKADLWCQIIGKKIYIITVKKLLYTIKNVKCWKVVDGGDNNSKLMLYRSSVLDNFVRIDNLEAEGVKRVILCLLENK